ncbi:hypothetical protein QFC22_000527 [Naganishia vaughanmartiniae]|uniref:Uncharacterized protein n=1 Tax=Naganishia vaughanmartiniae TaxID=1424756 RepID=A0ACC2XQC4_9TREE|nr:hypothetical protein QFC22_000527 [Naganishia vaughanmartiniae]
MANPLPRGLHHLESTVPHKFVSRYSPRVLPKKSFVQPGDRIARWNIRPGDHVRLTVGKPQEKWLNGKDLSGGWKVHRVTGVDMERNTVTLDGVTAVDREAMHVQHKRSNRILARPADYDQLGDDEKKNYDNQSNFLNLSRPVHYSNVQLCVHQRSKEEGGSVFATRLATSSPVFDKMIRQFRYDRFASKLENGSTDAYDVDPERGLVKIPWPDIRKKKLGAAQSDDTIAADVTTSTRTVLPITKIWEQPAQLPLPASSRASSTALPRQTSDQYIEQSAVSDVQPNVDALMPLYLTEELSPRFSRAKATKGFNLRRQAEALEKTAHATGQVRQWREGGGDTGLEGALAAVGLDRVSIRARTSKEVREAAEQEYAAAQHERSRIARMAKRVGGKFDVDNDAWKVQISPADAKRTAKKARRAVNREERLRATAL